MVKGRRAKALAKKDRLRKAEEREREEAALERNFQRLKQLTSGFARTPRPKGMKLEQEQNILFEEQGVVVKQRVGAHTLRRREQQRYEGEMALRELRAKLEARALKARVGQVGNKMGPQYLTDTDLEESKQGLMRRR